MNREMSEQLQSSRRSFLQQTASVAVATGGLLSARIASASADKPALLGGTPVHAGKWPGWPVSDEQEESRLLEVLRSGDWNRYRRGDAGNVAAFEQQWASDVGTSFCQATNSGTSALITALAAQGIGPGDEVLVQPYTFVATINAVLLHHALPVFVDTDPSTAQMDADQIEEQINGNTRAILLAHIGGSPCNMDRITDIAKSRDLRVVEDACQAHTAEWRGRRVGSLGDAGCFSFQNSKNMTSGDGGAITTDDRQLYARAQAFHNNGNGRFDDDGAYTAHGANLRLTEFQGAVLLAQFQRNEQLARRREENAAYLSRLLESIPGVGPKMTYPGTTRHGYHLYIFDYDPEQFAGMTKSRFLQALRAEGISVSGGYSALNKQPFVEQFLASPGFRRIYSQKRLQAYRDQNHLPANDRMIETTCWLTQNMLLSTKQDMESVATAIERIRSHSGALVQGA